jgi:hypothetical protein
MPGKILKLSSGALSNGLNVARGRMEARQASAFCCLVHHYLAGEHLVITVVSDLYLHLLLHIRPDSAGR